MQETSLTEEVTFDLAELIRYLFAKWKWFVTLGFSFAIIFASISITIPNEYTSEILLADVDSNSGGMDALGQLGGLASLAGVNLNSSKDKKLVSLQIFKSRQFLVDFVKNNQLEELLFAVESWDKETETFIYNSKVFDLQNKKWLPRSDRPISHYPTDLEIHEKMLSLIEVDVDKTNKVTTVELTYYNPYKAQEWLSKLVKSLNDNLRRTDIKEKEEQISLLQNELSQESNAEIRNVFYSLIQEQLKSSTLAKVRKEYIFRIIDPALLPEYKSTPQRALITVLGGLVGGIICFIFFTIRYILKR